LRHDRYKLAEGSEEFQAKLARIQEEANKARQKAAQEQHKAETLSSNDVVVPPIAARPLSQTKAQPNRVTKTKAAMLEVSRPAVERAATIQKKAPELAEKVARGVNRVHPPSLRLT
jgi:hypothetical protein